MKIPLVDLKAQYESIKSDIDSAIQAVLSETAFIGGKYVKKFEADFASLYGVRHVISCANGTDSLYIMMKMLGIGNGDEVITAANSWISSSETIGQTGATPIFCDVNPVYFSLDESLLEDLITPRTKAILVVHLQGQMCAMNKIESICQKHGLYLLEDCAQSHFSEYNARRAGLIGLAGSFSFYPGKNLGAYGDAGCIITNDDAFAEKCRMYANHGALVKHQHKIEGINSRLDGLQAAILSAKLPYILDWTRQRVAKADMYDKYLSNIPEITCPARRANCLHSFHLYVVKAHRRDELSAFLKEAGIETAVHYPTPLPLLTAYSHLEKKREDFPVSSALQSQILSLPIYPELEEAQIQYVAEMVRAFYNS